MTSTLRTRSVALLVALLAAVLPLPAAADTTGPPASEAPTPGAPTPEAPTSEAPDPDPGPSEPQVTLPLDDDSDASGETITFDPTLSADVASLELGIDIDDCNGPDVDESIYGDAGPPASTSLCAVITGGSPDEAFKLGDTIDLGFIEPFIVQEIIRIGWTDRYLVDQPGDDLVVADPGDLGSPEYLLARAKPVDGGVTAWHYVPADNFQDHDRAPGGDPAGVFHTAFDLTADLGLPDGSRVEYVELRNLEAGDTVGEGGVGRLGGGVAPTPGPLDDGDGIRRDERDPDVQYVFAVSEAHLVEPVDLALSPNAVQLTEVGQSMTVSALQFDEQGRELPLAGTTPVFASSDPEQVEVVDNGDGTATVTAVVADPTAEVTVSSATGPARTSRPAPVAVGAFIPDATIVPAEQVVYPPPTLLALPEGVTIDPAYPVPGFTTAEDGTARIGGFTPEEVDANISADDQYHAMVIEGATPEQYPVGSTVQAIEAGIGGTVLLSETIGTATLLRVDWTDLIRRLPIEVDFPILDGSPISECRITDADQGVVTAILEGYRDVDFDVQELENGLLWSFPIEVGIDVPLGTGVDGLIDVECDFKDAASITVETPELKKIAAIDVFADITPGTVGLQVDVDTAEVSGALDFQYRTGFVFEFGYDVDRVDEQGNPDPVIFDVKPNPDATSSFTYDDDDTDPVRLTGVGDVSPRFDIGLRPSLRAETIADFLKWKVGQTFSPFSRKYAVSDITMNFESKVVWENTPERLLSDPNDGETPPTAQLAVNGAWEVGSSGADTMNQIFAGVLGLEDVQIPDSTLWEYEPQVFRWFSTLSSTTVAVDGLVVTGPGGGGGSGYVATAAGDDIEIEASTVLDEEVSRVDFEAEDALTITTDDPAEAGIPPTRGSVWVAIDDTRTEFVPVDGVTSDADGNTLSVTLPVTEELCDALASASSDGAPRGTVELLGYNTLLGLDTPGKLGQIPLDCAGDRVRFSANDVTFPDLGGNNRAVVGQECVAVDNDPETDELARDIALSASVTTLPVGRWGVTEATLSLIDPSGVADELATFTADGEPPGELELPTPPEVRDLLPGETTFELRYTAVDLVTGETRDEVVGGPDDTSGGAQPGTFTVGLKPCLSAQDVVLILDTSGSIDADEFALEQQFAVELIDGLPVSEDDTKVGVTQFASSAGEILPLSGNAASAISAVTSIDKGAFGSGTNLGPAISSAQSTVSGEGGRPDDQRPNALIVVADGDGGGAAEAEEAKNAGSTIIGVGVGNGVNVANLQNIASDPSLVFLPSDFDSLIYVLEALLPASADPVP